MATVFWVEEVHEYTRRRLTETFPTREEAWEEALRLGSTLFGELVRADVGDLVVDSDDEDDDRFLVVTGV